MALSLDDNKAKTISNTVDMHRLLKMYKPVYSFLFPKTGLQTSVTKFECTFNVEILKFEVKAVDLPLTTVHADSEVLSVLHILPTYFANFLM